MLFCNVLFYGHSYLLHEISFARRVLGYSALRLCFISHCGYVLRPIVIILSLWFYSKRCMCEFSVYGSFPMWYCVCKCINTKNLPTDFHWSMGRLLHTIVMYGVMVVCIVGIVFYLLAYIIIIQSGGGKSNKKNVF